jgi:hypothetical protein
MLTLLKRMQRRHLVCPEWWMSWRPGLQRFSSGTRQENGVHTSASTILISFWDACRCRWVLFTVVVDGNDQHFLTHVTVTPGATSLATRLSWPLLLVQIFMTSPSYRRSTFRLGWEAFSGVKYLLQGQFKGIDYWDTISADRCTWFCTSKTAAIGWIARKEHRILDSTPWSFSLFSTALWDVSRKTIPDHCGGRSQASTTFRRTDGSTGLQPRRCYSHRGFVSSKDGHSFRC